MRNLNPTIRRTLRATMLAALAAIVMLPVLPARAEDDDDESLDNKVFRNILEGMGIRPKDNNIEYRERSPLVVPPNISALPSPEGADKAQASSPANWPVDPDVKRAKEAKAAARKARAKGGDSVMEDGRPLMPDELNKRSAGRGNDSNRTTMEESARPMKPSALGYMGNLFSKTFNDEKDVAVFRGEPTRENLTDPPPGYQTPSPNQPYGLTGVKPLPKAEGKNLEAAR